LNRLRDRLHERGGAQRRTAGRDEASALHRRCRDFVANPS
jgi:hypothetical protein